MYSYLNKNLIYFNKIKIYKYFLMNNVDSLTINKNDSENYKYPENHQSNETKTTNFFSPIINSSHIPNNISINENTRKKDFIKINSQTVNKKTLVLDLDETLVHSSMTPFPKGSDLTIEINVAGNKYNVYVLKRPFLEEFLKEMSYLYEILVFTASLAEYAEPLLEILDKNKIIKYKLNRNHCLFYQGTYIKDLKVINRNIKDLIIIDNNPASYVLNQENGIPILSWFDNPNDMELMRLVPLLKYLSKVSDVRSIIKQIIDKDDNNKLDFNIINKIIDKKSNNDNNAACSNNQVIKNNLNINIINSNDNNNIISNKITISNANNNNISSNVNNNITSNVDNNNNITLHANNNITPNINNNIISNTNNNNNITLHVNNNNENINKHESTSLNKDNNKNITKFIYIKKEISCNKLNKNKRMKSNLNNKINYTYDNNKMNNNINNKNVINNTNNNNKSNNNINIINNYNNKNLNNNVFKNINNKDYNITNLNNINNSNNAINRKIKSFNNLCINNNNNINFISKPKFNLINNHINKNINENNNIKYQSNIKNINSNEQNNFNKKNDNNNFSIINDFDKKNNKKIDDKNKFNINYIKVNQENKDYNVAITQPNSKAISINKNNNSKTNQYNQNNNKILGNKITPTNNKILGNQIILSNSSKNFYTNRPMKNNVNINIINSNYNNGNANTINPNRGSMNFSNYKTLNNMEFKNNKDNIIQFNKAKLINPKTPKKEDIKTATVVKLTNHNSENKNNINQDIYYNNATKQDLSKNLFGDNKIYENKNNFLSTERIPKVKIMKPNNNLNINNNISDQNVIININNPIIANYYEDNKKNNIKYVETLNKATKVKLNNKTKNNDRNYENIKTEYNNNNPNKFLGNCKIKKIEVNANKGQISPLKINKIKVKQFFDKEIGKEDKILFHNISTSKIKPTSKGPFNRKQYLEENFEINK